MGDLVTGICVIGRAGAYDQSWTTENLLFRVRGEFHMIFIRRKGTPPTVGINDAHQWQYEERDGKLHIEPSLLVKAGPNEGFHTDFHWVVDFVRPKTKRQNPHRLFDKLNPPPKGQHI